MRHPDQEATPVRTAVTPLDYASPGPRRVGRETPRVIKVIVVLAIVLLLIVIVMPSNGGSRHFAERISCAANFRSIGQAIQIYAYDHGGHYPDTLGDVVAGGYATDVRIFLCPTCADTPAKGATPAARAVDLAAGGHLSYVYVGRGLTRNADGYTVIAYEPATHHEGRGGNVLFADGHVEWHSAAELRPVIDWHAAGKGPMIKGRGAAPPRPATRAATRPASRPAP